MMFGQLQACPRLVQFAVYFSRINGPNEDSGRGRRVLRVRMFLVVGSL